MRFGRALLAAAFLSVASPAWAQAPDPAAPARAQAQAQDPSKYEPPYLGSPVIDEVGLLGADSVARIAAALRSFHAQGKLQMVVFIPSSLHGMDIESFGIRTAEAWKLGRKGQDQGLILIVAPNERQMRLEVGYGLEGQLTDAFSRQVLDDVMRPYFRDRRYGDGVLAAIGAISDKLGVRAEVPQVAPVQKRGTASLGGNGLVILLALCFFAFVFVSRIAGLGARRGFSRYGRGRSSIFWGGGGGGWGGGGGGWGGGGGFGGGGGGFGGGGASSSW